MFLMRTERSLRYLIPLTKPTSQQALKLCEVFNGPRYIPKTGAPWRVRNRTKYTTPENIAKLAADA